MKTSVKLILNTHRALKDGRYPVVFQLIRNRQRKFIYTSFRLFITEFEAKTEKAIYVTGGNMTRKQVQEINNNLKKTCDTIKETITRLEKFWPAYTTEKLVQSYYLQNNNRYLLSWLENIMSEKLEAGKPGAATAFKSTLRSLMHFIGIEKMLVKDVDAAFVKRYETYLYSKSIKPNTVAFYLRNLRSVYNRAVREQHELRDTQPFKGIKMNPEKTIKRALDRETIRKIAHADLSYSLPLEMARDLFIFSFYTRGMPFVDIVNLKKENINGRMICYYRGKTHQLLQISINTQIQEILDRYTGGEFLFPLLEGSLADRYKKYRMYLAYINRNLKRVAEKLDINVPLTTYVARHTWATLAKKSGAPTSVISESLGHTSEKTTQIYLKQFDHDIIDKMNDEITRL